MNKSPLVSIVIPTKNAEKYFERCLDSIKGQSYKNIEIIVVDNYSNDKTRELAKKHTNNIFLKGPERTAQTNFGAEKARGKYVYRVDPDFILERDVVKEAVEKCEKENLGAVAIHNTSDPSISFWAKVRKFERDMYIDDDLIVGARFYRKEAWRKIGGYNDNIILDDYDFHNRLIKYYKWGRIKAKEYHLGEPKDLITIFKKSYFYGKQVPPYLKKYPMRGFNQSHPLKRSYIRHWRDFISNPILTLGFLIMILVKYLGGFLGIISTLFKNQTVK